MSPRPRMVAAACLLAVSLGCSKTQDAPVPAGTKPALPTTGAAPRAPEAPEAPEAAEAPATPTAPADTTPRRTPRPHEQGAKLPPAPEGMIWISGTVNRAPGVFKPITSVTDVCVHERKDLPCADTDSAGHYDIAVPRSSQIALLYSADGLTPTLRVFVSGTEDLNIGNTRVANAEGLERISKALGLEHRADRGGIFFAGTQGTTATLEPESGTRFFLDYDSSLVDDAVGVPMRGSGGFVGVMPGKTAIRFAHTDGPCVYRADNPMGGWPDPADPGVAIVPVLPGHHIHMTSMYCGKDNAPASPATTRPAVQAPAKASAGPK